MKLDRNINGTGHGKYALLKLRCLADLDARKDQMPTTIEEVNNALNLLARLGILDWGDTPETEFFVMRLKDQYAISGLYSYGLAALKDDPEYGSEVIDLAKRAGPYHPNCKKPD